MLLIFDASQGYPARCLGTHNIDNDEPERVTGIPGAVGMPSGAYGHADVPYLTLSAHPDDAGVVVFDDASKNEEEARRGVGGLDLLSLVVAVGALNFIVRKNVTGLSPQEEQALDIVADALPDVSTLRTLLARPGLPRALERVKTILETLAGS